MHHDKGSQMTHAWLKTMMLVGSNFLVSTVERAVTPNPSGTSVMEKTITP